MTPVLGGIVEMVKDPYTFWERQRLYSFPGLSWTSLVGQFTVFVTDAALCRHVFNHNSKDTLLMALHPRCGHAGPAAMQAGDEASVHDQAYAPPSSHGTLFPTCMHAREQRCHICTR